VGVALGASAFRAAVPEDIILKHIGEKVNSDKAHVQLVHVGVQSAHSAARVSHVAMKRESSGVHDAGRTNERKDSQ
jgi:hypothetical protein